MIDEDRSQWSLEELAAECIEACELPMGCRGTIIATLHDAKEQGRAKSAAYAGKLADAGYEAWHSWADGVNEGDTYPDEMIALRDLVTDACPDCDGKFGDGDFHDYCRTCKGFGRIKKAALAQAPEGAKEIQGKAGSTPARLPSSGETGERFESADGSRGDKGTDGTSVKASAESGVGANTFAEPGGLSGSVDHDIPWAPPGYRLVPIEATEEMLRASSRFAFMDEPRTRRVWKEMLDAAPVVGVERGPSGGRLEEPKNG